MLNPFLGAIEKGLEEEQWVGRQVAPLSAPWSEDSKDDQGSSSNVRRTAKELCVKEACDKERKRPWLCALEVFQLSTL